VEKKVEMVEVEMGVEMCVKTGRKWKSGEKVVKKAVTWKWKTWKWKTWKWKTWKWKWKQWKWK